MLPSDWAKSNSSPTNLRLPDPGRAELHQRYGPVAGSDPVLPTVFDVVEASGATQASIEYDYIDADYRDEFANFYATTFRPLPDRCERLHFFKKDQYLGFSVVRPILERPICRTLLTPPPALARDVACVAGCEVHPYGVAYPVSGFPFLSQDFQFGVCAHAAIWMIAHYYHLKRSHGRYFMSDIVEAARQHEIGRSVPSTGLHQLQIAAAFRQLKLPTIQYVEQTLKGLNETFERLACRYLNSRIPVLLLLPAHAMVLIGYGRGSDGSLYFVVHDDATGPYRKIGDSGSDPACHWQGLVVPLPGKIYLTAEAAERTGQEHLATLIATEDDLEPLRKLSLRYRTYVISSSEYKSELITRGVPPDVAQWHRITGASHWIWVVEAQDNQVAMTSRNCVLGEIAIDATSDPLTPFPLFGNLPGMMMRWTELNGPMGRARSSQSESLRYGTGSAIHT